MTTPKSGETSARTLAVPEMAQRLHLSENTIRTYATSRRYAHLLPPSFKRPGGRRLLWDAAEVEAWLNSGKPDTAKVQRKPRGRPTKAEQLRRRLAEGAP